MKKTVYLYIVLIFLIPSFGMLFYSGVYVTDKYDTLKNVKHVRENINYVKFSETLLNSLQRERGISSVYVSSGGLTFKDKLILERKATDIAFTEFDNKTKNHTLQDEKNKKHIADIKQLYKNIKIIRKDIDSLNTNYKKLLEKYTALNKLIVNSISFRLLHSNSDTLLNSFSSIVDLIKIKEYSGIERAVLSHIFTDGYSNINGTFEYLINAISIQNIYTEEFILYSNKENSNIFKQHINNTESRINTYRGKVLDIKSFNQNSSYNVNPIEWWDISTNRIDTFGKVIDKITTSTLNKLTVIENDSRLALVFSLIFWIIGFFGLLIALYYLKQLMQIQKDNYKQKTKQKYINDILIKTNELIIYEHTENQLFNEICNVSVKDSNLSLAFVGMIEDNNDIKIVSSSGSAVDYLSQLSLTIDPNHKEKNLGLAGKAILEDRNIIIDNILDDGSSLLHKVAIKYNLHSAAAYPIREFNKTIGVIVLYAKEVNFFDKEIMLIIDKMVNNISFALEKIYYEKIRKDEEEQLVYKAQHDSLTDLPNRFLFMERLDYSIKTKNRTDIKGAVIFIDLDNFKPVNDNFGHHIGDLLLIKVAKILKNTIRQEDTVARLGGDEFVILIDHLNNDTEDQDKKILTEITDKIRSSIEQTHILDGENINISASIGVVLFPEEFKNPTEIIKASDEAMYSSKKSGKNKVIFYN